MLVCYYEPRPNEDKEIRGLVGSLATFFETYTKPFKGSNKKVIAMSAKIGPNELKTADELLFPKDIASCLLDMYPNAINFLRHIQSLLRQIFKVLHHLTKIRNYTSQSRNL